MDFPIDHDLHCHSRLSLCSNDPAQTPEAILAHAKARGYSCVCLTDHFWDSPAVPGASGFYAPQDQLATVPEVGPSVVSALGLSARHLYRLP